jgi:hypothetical protein
MNKKVKSLINLIDQDYKKVQSILSDTTVEELEAIVSDSYWAVWSDEHPNISAFELSELALETRKRILNAEFICTPDFIAKIRRLDEDISDLQNMLCKETEQQIIRHQKANDEDGLDNYKLVFRCVILPYIKEKRSYTKKIDDILYAKSPNFLPFEGIDSKELRNNEYFKAKRNWNDWDMPIQIYAESFDVSLGMFQLCTHSPFSLSDIFRINRLEGEVKIGEHRLIYVDMTIY